MKKSLLIGGLAVAIIAAAAINFYPQKVDQPRGERFKGRMIEKLNLTDEQKDKIEQLKIDHQKAMIDLRTDLQKKRLAMRELMQKGNYSRSDYLNLVKEISSARAKITEARANHRMDVYELLTDQQKKIFNEMPMMRGSRGEGRGMMNGPGMMGGKHPRCMQQ